MSTASKKHTSAGDEKARVRKIIARLEKVHADAKLDLDFRNPLELLIALILAAQARDDLVNKITVELFKKNRSAADYADIAAEPAGKPDRQDQLLSQQSQIDS